VTKGTGRGGVGDGGRGHESIADNRFANISIFLDFWAKHRSRDG